MSNQQEPASDLQAPLNPMPVRSFVPVAIGALRALIALLAFSVVCVKTGVGGDGDGWAGLIFGAPFTGFFAFVVYRIPRRLAELRRWEQDVARTDALANATGSQQPGAAQTVDSFVWLRQRYWRFRWWLTAMLLLSLSSLALTWHDSPWWWRVATAGCSVAFGWTLSRGWQQARRDRR